ncbi:ABCB family ABC transporter ATP-binding protein/permease [Thalassotalea eurytherma]|uniref:ABC transporter n=1 Tax=Thalassotalea eurytherma TaxID=1144278 RepID=A0ABQ6H2A8_9GAMM|nr:ABC transporter ATP-binding protein/permease [Thalassotalea eurytherma]GLX82316.1 ABC transporter [Thalassotalea eurytherma]
MRRTNYPDHEVDQLNWRVLKLVYPYLLEFKWRISIAVICLILAKVASVYLPFVLKDVVDTLDSSVENNLMLVPFGLVAAYGLARLSVVLFGEIRDTLFGRVTERAIRRIGLKVFKHLHSLELAFHLNRQTGGISRDIDRGNSGISFLMRFMVFNIVPTLLEIAMVIGVLFFKYHWGFAAITATSITFYISYTIYATEWRTGFIRAANKADSSSNTRAIDSLLNYETVKYFNNEDYEANRYDAQLAQWEKAKTQNRLSLFALNGGQATIVAVAMTSMLALAAHQVVHNHMTLGDFVLINAFMMQLFMPLNFLGFVYREIKGSLANIEGMFSLLQKQPAVTDKANAKALTVDTSAISFEDVTFGYHKDRDVLKGISFDVLAGQKVAIVGDSGSGKSTIVKLLFRFYDTAKGRIAIDDQAVDDVTQNSLRQHIGIVPQDTVLFNDSIFENVRYGKPDASDADVRMALKMAYLDDLISKLPDGEHTMVGERGLKLSGGEKQRVAIARTLLKNPEIWVFDEATSALDSYAEQEILKAIRSVARDKTTLVIAHRLSTVTDADIILVMSDGKIVEQGSHHELLALQERYFNMWQLQQTS